ncbi:hypothetical protein [Winogradskya humida]|uniref:hypothetical protein n=1 Tax=Winogradskya humida TaxID=113566 RepID=UPI001942900B|nr:hypothetical protein [Actinoplanes humidus]
MGGEEFGEQCLELAALRLGEAGQQLILDLVSVFLQVVKVVAARLGEADDVTAAVGGVGMGRAEAAEDGVDVVAVEAETAAEAGLAERAVFLQGGEDGEVGPGTSS